jgi:hypothetical protein
MASDTETARQAKLTALLAIKKDFSNGSATEKAV